MLYHQITSKSYQKMDYLEKGALKELSRDNPGLDHDNDDDQDSTALESGAFKTASEEAVATRRIVRGVGCKSGTVITEEAKGDNGNSNTDKGSDCGVDKSEAVNGGETAEDETKTTIETQKAKDDEGSDCGVDKDSAGGQTEKEGTDKNGDNSGFFTSLELLPSSHQRKRFQWKQEKRTREQPSQLLIQYCSNTLKEDGKSVGKDKLILNASLYPEMKLASMDKKGITFACVRESKSGLSTFAFKFKDPAIVEKFRAVIEEHKKSKPMSVKAVAAPLKTPENSPEG
ncbi:hypothetical protein YC2023_030273 [Brassica napus]|uniref:(rape) hypothetical protein n=1 Tax=Brassica napus TaxID=3708 RepID=A0A816W1E3_BRANA|nr:unnamed protein product [Brassica napus]